MFSEGARRFYEQLLTIGGRALAEITDPVEHAALAELRERGLVWESVDLPVVVHPVTPLTALRRLLMRWRRDTAEQQLRVLSHAAWLEGLDGRPATRLTDQTRLGVTLHVDRTEIIGIQRELVLGARRECRNLETHHFTVWPTSRATLTAPTTARARGVRHRSICTDALMTDDTCRGLIRQALAAGEEYRVLPDLPMKMVLADDTALVALTPIGVEAAMLIHAPVVVAALGDYFEMLWQRAAALSPPDEAGTLSARRREVLRLAATGLKDEAIARTLGLSTRSVRRHIDALEREVGAVNRLTLGIEASRRGWV
ncbi:LuxR C-terminal-related transcriptional regulator [Micromonospora sp. NPDC003197]